MPTHVATHFTALDFRGPDAAAFLQGYLTADLDGLGAGSALPMAYCSIKGRVVASGWAAGDSSHVRLVIHASVADRLAADLGKYLLFAKSKLAHTEGGLRIAPDPSAGAVALPPTSHFATFDAPADEGHAALAAACVAAGFVVVAEPVSQAFLPQMIGLTDVGAVSFAKGCYLGQEVVARAEHRGEVKQKLRRYLFAGKPPPVGADIIDDGSKIGVVAAIGQGFALAAVRSDASPVVAAGCRLTAAASL